MTDGENSGEVVVVLEVTKSKNGFEGLPHAGQSKQIIDGVDGALKAFRTVFVRGIADDFHVFPILESCVRDTT